MEVTVKPLNSTAVVIQWKEPQNPNSPVLNYYVEMLEETFTDMFLVSTSVTVGPSVSELAIGKLRPFTNYIARVAVQTKVGKRFSDEVFFTTSKSGELRTEALVTHFFLNMKAKTYSVETSVIFSYNDKFEFDLLTFLQSYDNRCYLNALLE